jgi:ribonuclease-3
LSNSVSRLIKKLGHNFSDVSLVELALTHRSVGNNNNERLEFLGDSILGFVIAEALCARFPDAREGDLSRMRAQLVKGKTLAEVGREFELGEHLILGPGEMKSGGHRRDSILADAVEALIGAMYLDAGMNTCKANILNWFASRLQSVSPEANIKDAKTRLQEFMQAKKKALPVYHLLAASGAEHDQIFQIECELQGVKQRFQGEASSRRSAEQTAAQVALDYLQRQP